MALAVLVLLLISIAGCSDDNGSNPGDEELWDFPSNDSYKLYLDLYPDSFWVDTINAGSIQYALNRARGVDGGLLNFHLPAGVHHDQVSIVLFDSLLEQLDTLTFRYNHPELDSLLDQLPVHSASYTHFPPTVTYWFSRPLNVQMLARQIEDIAADDGVVDAVGYKPNIADSRWVTLSWGRSEGIYSFLFSKSLLTYNQYWLIEVDGREATLINKWTE